MDLPEWASKVDSRTRLRHVIEELAQFPSEQKNVPAQVFQPNQVPEGLLERIKVVANRYFAQDERKVFASLVMRQWDVSSARTTPGFNFHSFIRLSLHASDYL